MAEYDEEADGFQFTKKAGRRKKEAKEPTARNSLDEPPADKIALPPSPRPRKASAPPNSTVQEAVRKTTQKKSRRRFPTTPDRDDTEKPIRRSKRQSDERQPEPAPQPRQSPQRPSHAKSHANVERSPSPGRARPVTVEKKRQTKGVGGVEETKIMQIALPFADTPVQRRNKEMRKTSAEGHRRSSAGMRGRRASSVIDEGRGHGKMHSFSFLCVLT